MLIICFIGQLQQNVKKKPEVNIPIILVVGLNIHDDGK